MAGVDVGRGTGANVKGLRPWTRIRPAVRRGPHCGCFTLIDLEVRWGHRQLVIRKRVLSDRDLFDDTSEVVGLAVVLVDLQVRLAVVRKAGSGRPALVR